MSSIARMSRESVLIINLLNIYLILMSERNPNDRIGSTAACRQFITSAAASGCFPAVRLLFIQLLKSECQVSQTAVVQP